MPSDVPATQLTLAFPARLALTRGKIALIAPEDLTWARRWSWQAMRIGRTWYASRAQERGGRRRTIYLHRAIWRRHYGPIPAGAIVDHADGNGLNDLPGNLRLATYTLNNANARKRRGAYTSRYKGVGWCEPARRWRARIKRDGRELLLGYFESEEDAARAYDAAALEVFGEFAKLNFEQERRTHASYPPSPRPSVARAAAVGGQGLAPAQVVGERGLAPAGA